jgi:hypothetical protein
MTSGQWAWVVGLVSLGSFETWATLTHHATMSDALWAAGVAHPWLVLPLVLGALVTLGLHFIVPIVTRRRRQP